MPTALHDSCAHCGHHHELTVENLSVRYPEGLALDGVSFATSCGSCVALIGPNGAGKSTLLKAIAGLQPIAAGKIFWRGTLVAKWSREIAYLPQRENVDWQFPITVRGDVSMGRYHSPARTPMPSSTHSLPWACWTCSTAKSAP